MDELRFVRREELALIVANEADEEFRLVVDDAVLAELRHLQRRERAVSDVRPREIQALLRAGNSREEVAAQTGLEETDIERYEEPVRAEREYIQTLAGDVLVRADSNSEVSQRFGTVIEKRLRSLDAKNIVWSAWREAGSDWNVCVTFDAAESSHRATWSFDHRKSMLSPESPDAVNLSRQGEIGEQLIPRLRVVDAQRADFEVDAFDEGAADATEADDTERAERGTAVDDPDTEYARRREIDQRAMSTDAEGGSDLSQTADLLNALRERRGQREKELEEATERHPSSYGGPQRGDAEQRQPKPPTLWSVPGVGGGQQADTGEDDSAGSGQPTLDASDLPDDTITKAKPSPSRKGRASVPSWDDILFGTRSEDDPA